MDVTLIFNNFIFSGKSRDTAYRDFFIKKAIRKSAPRLSKSCHQIVLQAQGSYGRTE